MAQVNDVASALMYAQARQQAYFDCQRDPYQSVHTRRLAVMYLAEKVALTGDLEFSDRLLYTRVLAPSTLPDPLRAFWSLVFEIAAPGIDKCIDRILPADAP